MTTTSQPRLGHVHLKVRDAAPAVRFYQDVFGLRITEQLGDQFVFLTDGDAHHTLALQGVGSAAALPVRGAVGLYHVAYEVENELAFARFFLKLRALGVHPNVVDHGISWAMYFADPDGNGLEVYADRRHTLKGRESWTGHSLPIADATLEALVSQADAPAA